MTQWTSGGLLIAIVTCALGQDRDPSDVRSSVADAAGSIQTAFDCSISISGEPVLHEFSRKWEIAFFASGPDCDAAHAELQQRVAPLEVLLYRRPDLAQVRSIVSELFTSVRSFGCQVELRQEPSFDAASGQWSVPYRAAGDGCDDAAEFLRDVGVERQIFFWRVVSRQELIR